MQSLSTTKEWEISPVWWKHGENNGKGENTNSFNPS